MKLPIVMRGRDPRTRQLRRPENKSAGDGGLEFGA
jgi:hypothetical protein